MALSKPQKDLHNLRAAVLGHSFVDHFKDYLRKAKGKHSRRNFTEDFELQHIRLNGHRAGYAEVRMYGMSGLKIAEDDELEWLIECVRRFRPHVALCELGSNDLSSGPLDDHVTLIEKLLIFHRKLIELGVRAVGYVHVVGRRSYFRDGVTEQVSEQRRKRFNELLRAQEGIEPHLVYFKSPRSQLNRLDPSLTKDGTHYNDAGHKMYKDSLRNLFFILGRRV